MCSLSNDIIILDVVSLLGVKDLLHFRCVSKALCSSIDDPYFINLHLSQSLKTNTNLYLIFRDNCTFSVDFLSLETAHLKAPPITLHQRDMEILCSCNGLLALRNGSREILLWNPSTGKSQILPFTHLEFPPWACRSQDPVFGLGYDPISDDYKLVQIARFHGKAADCFACEVKVYSLRTNSWKRIKGLPFFLKCNQRERNYGYKRVSGVLANDALQFLFSEKLPLKSDTRSFIVGFVLGTEEEYSIVELPGCLANGFRMDIKAMCGCLCLIGNYGEIDDDVDIWMMKEYGIKESWTKLISLKRSEFVPAFKFVSPTVLSKNADKILLNIENKKFVWYDMRSKIMDTLSIEGCVESSFEVEMLVKSLVRPSQS